MLTHEDRNFTKVNTGFCLQRDGIGIYNITILKNIPQAATLSSDNSIILWPSSPQKAQVQSSC